MAENKTVETVTYYCKQTKQEVTVVKGSQKHVTLKSHIMWTEGTLPAELKPKVKTV